MAFPSPIRTLARRTSGPKPTPMPSRAIAKPCQPLWFVDNGKAGGRDYQLDLLREQRSLGPADCLRPRKAIMVNHAEVAPGILLHGAWGMRLETKADFQKCADK